VEKDGPHLYAPFGQLSVDRDSTMNWSRMEAPLFLSEQEFANTELVRNHHYRRTRRPNKTCTCNCTLHRCYWK
jgi:hypothetical protein